jgi:hypothetical protein
MTVAEKILRAKDDYDAVYEAGKKAENDAFWETYQNGGNRTVYSSAFNHMSDEIYNPKYPITIKGHSSNGNSMFVNATITDVKVPIIYDDALTGVSSSLFSNARQLETIPLVHVNENISFTAWFNSCNNLKNITFEGVIGQSGINLWQATLLSKASIENIIGCLSDTASGKTLTLSKVAVDGKTFDLDISPYPFVDTDKTERGMTYTDNGDGSISMNGTATGDSYFIISHRSDFEVGVGRYTFSLPCSGDNEGTFLEIKAYDTKTWAYQRFEINANQSTTVYFDNNRYLAITLQNSGGYANNSVVTPKVEMPNVRSWDSLVATKPNWTITLV